MYQIPILFLIFNRPDQTSQVFSKIRDLKPKYLFVAADGPRQFKEGEDFLCESTRKLVLEQIDWDCELHTLFRKENLGCGRAVSSALSWFFKHVDMGVILEDDCLPNDSFFKYCEDLLLRYKFDDRVKMISGNNFDRQRKLSFRYSYDFSSYSHIWGWATWKRVWDQYDYEISEETQKQFLKARIKYKFDYRIRRHISDLVTNVGVVDTWDYQFTICIMRHDGLCVYPDRNLVSNIGFSHNATHTRNSSDPMAQLPTREFEFPLTHPVDIKKSVKIDKFTLKEVWGYRSLIQTLKSKLFLFF